MWKRSHQRALGDIPEEKRSRAQQVWKLVEQQAPELGDIEGTHFDYPSVFSPAVLANVERQLETDLVVHSTELVFPNIQDQSRALATSLYSGLVEELRYQHMPIDEVETFLDTYSLPLLNNLGRGISESRLYYLWFHEMSVIDIGLGLPNPSIPVLLTVARKLYFPDTPRLKLEDSELKKKLKDPLLLVALGFKLDPVIDRPRVVPVIPTAKGEEPPRNWVPPPIWPLPSELPNPWRGYASGKDPSTIQKLREAIEEIRLAMINDAYGPGGIKNIEATEAMQAEAKLLSPTCQRFTRAQLLDIIGQLWLYVPPSLLCKILQIYGGRIGLELEGAEDCSDRTREELVPLLNEVTAQLTRGSLCEIIREFGPRVGFEIRDRSILGFSVPASDVRLF